MEKLETGDYNDGSLALDAMNRKLIWSSEKLMSELNIDPFGDECRRDFSVSLLFISGNETDWNVRVFTGKNVFYLIGLSGILIPFPFVYGGGFCQFRSKIGKLSSSLGRSTPRLLEERT